ncbi:MAG: hypothetical protein K2G55_06620 [Lachnospiraceae bacterium]|nr:hypothetical protein [Lachnospiraceae bacterium]MDE7201766.1 hypothetical protein [Lachnospiraceae bacterium]
MEVYNKNRDKNNSMHDEIREQNAKLKGAPLKEKCAYFKEYYLKTTIVALIAVILVAYLAYSILTAPSDTAFAAFFYNDTGDSSSTELVDGFVQYMNIDTKEHEAYIDATMNYMPDASDYDAYMGLEKSMAVISTGELDVIVGDTATLDYFARSECLHNITTILPDDLLAQFEDKLYYVESSGSAERIPVGVYVTDSPKLNQYYYYVDKEPILGFVINSNSMDNAIAFLRYIYME